MKKIIFTLGILIWISLSCFTVRSADILAGYISAKHISGLEYELTLTTWTNINHQSLKRCAADITVLLNGVAEPFLLNVPRVNGPDMSFVPQACPLMNPKAGETVRGSIRKNIYQTNYTFSAAGTAKILYQAFAREYNIINSRLPHMSNFSVEAEFEITNTGTPNSTPELAQDLLINAPSGSRMAISGFVADNSDNDVQTFTMSTPMAVTDYKLPSHQDYGAGSFTIDILSGELVWDMPSVAGIYLATIKVEDIRSTTVIGYNTIDMILEVDRAAGLEEVVSSPVSISPNPVNDQMEVSFDLIKPSTVEAYLFDLTGRRVQTLTNEQATQGNFNRNWAIDPSIGTGVYFLRMKINGEEETRKVAVKR